MSEVDEGDDVSWRITYDPRAIRMRRREEHRIDYQYVRKNICGGSHLGARQEKKRREHERREHFIKAQAAERHREHLAAEIRVNMLAAGTRGEPMESQMDRVMKAQLSLGEASVKKQQERDRKEKEARKLALRRESDRKKRAEVKSLQIQLDQARHSVEKARHSLATLDQDSAIALQSAAEARKAHLEQTVGEEQRRLAQLEAKLTDELIDQVMRNEEEARQTLAARIVGLLWVGRCARALRVAHAAAAAFSCAIVAPARLHVTY